MADALDRGFGASRAVLVGAWNYAEFESVPAARHSFDRFAEMLTGPLGNWPEDRITRFPDVAAPGDLPTRLIEAFEGVTDVALFYFVGHGQYDANTQLCLALGQSRRESRYRKATSLTFEQVRDAFQDCPARTKIAILDCCFAGLAAETAGRLADDRALPAAHGFYLIMASGPYSPAWYQLDGEAERPQTYLTKYLVDAVDSGIPGEGDGIRLGRLFDTVADRLVRDGKPRPGSHAGNQAGSFLIARNRAAGLRGRELTTEATLSFRESLRETPVLLKVPTRCELCHGTGVVGERRCDGCEGSGHGAQLRTVETRLPRGVADGQRIRLAGQGFAGPGDGPAGDLLVTVHVLPDPEFTRADADLGLDLPVSHTERLHGTTVSVRSPSGEWVAVAIPPGTPYGTVVPVRHFGVDLADGRGDLLVRLTAAEPSDERSDEELRPPGPAAARRPPAPEATGPVTVYRASLRRILINWWLLLVCAGLAALALVLTDLLNRWTGLHSWGSFLGPLSGALLLALGRRTYLRRRPPLRLTDDGVEYARFGYLPWSDVAGVWPSAPGHPWVTVLLRRKRELSTGQESPLVVPVILLADLRRTPEPVTDAMRRHCPSLLVHART
ncbi:DnaJ C-terminal domain-containing protein [Kitasatospora sp. NPDC058965]|uniref:caspase, EACC1-associated type n=1 Tax=Kitasatospora sp. NPDC058965 TaxID=3346682 RepID=UPI00368B89F0